MHKKVNKNDNLLKMFILDVLKYDIEPISSIMNLLNDRNCIGWRDFWPIDFTAEDIIPALDTLVNESLVETYYYDQEIGGLNKIKVSIKTIEIDSVWFGLTERGRKVWDEWVPPEEMIEK